MGCVSKDDVCCENVLGNYFPCQGNGGGCCGNACFAPGSKCCKSPFVAKARWYPVTKDTKCAFGWPWRRGKLGEALDPSNLAIRNCTWLQSVSSTCLHLAEA